MVANISPKKGSRPSKTNKKNTNLSRLITLVLFLIGSLSIAVVTAHVAASPSPTIPTPAPSATGRIAISSDGNDHDCDDLTATAMTIALLAKTGNASNLVYYGHSDHHWSSNRTESCGSVTDREAEMHISSHGTAEVWGGFNLGVFINARANTSTAISNLTAAINASSAGDPLSIIAAGPMDIVGQALDAAGSNRQFVTVISHSDWNDNHSDNAEGNEPAHSGWTWAEMQAAFSTVKFTHITDQNPGLAVPESNYFWLRDSSDPKLTWLWNRHVVSGEAREGHFDPSDAGMIYWLITGGNNGGDQNATPAKLRAILETTPTPTPTPTPTATPTPPPTPTPTPTPTSALAPLLVTAPAGTPLHPVTSGTTINLAALPTRSLSINIVTTVPVGSVRLQHNGGDATENVAPYALAGDTDGEFHPANLSVGAHTLTVTPYSQPNLGGTAGTPTTILFSVVDTANGTPPNLLTDPASGRAIALNAATFVAEPFALFTRENFGSDKRTRLLLFVSDFESSSGSIGADTVVHAENSVLGTHSLAIEHVERVPGVDWLTQITVVLPDGLANAGDVWVRVVLRGLSSKQAPISIREPTEVGTFPTTRMTLLVDSWMASNFRLHGPLATSRPRAS